MRDTRLRRRRLPKPTDSGTWVFLNSAFGLWVLSAVFISGAGALLTRWYAARDSEVANRHMIQKLDAEISYRLSQTFAALHEARDHSSQASSNEKRAEISRILRWLDEPPAGAHLAPLYPEFGSYGFPTLVAELELRIGEEDNDWSSVDRALQTLANRQSNTIAEDFAVAAEALHVDFNLERWKLFGYTRCTPDDPFCTGETVMHGPGFK